MSVRRSISPLQHAMLTAFLHAEHAIGWATLASFNQNTLWSLIHNKWIREQNNGMRITGLGVEVMNPYTLGTDFGRSNPTLPICARIRNEVSRKVAGVIPITRRVA